ncbi:MAG: hypothetical protein AAF597_08055, partial [Bacteroidota bacterium]
MLRRAQSLFFLLFFLITGVAQAQPAFFAHPGHKSNNDRPHGHHDHTDQPLRFVTNEGQWDDRVLYAADLGGLNQLYLEHDRLTFLFFDAEQTADLHDVMQAYPGRDDIFNLSGHAYRVNFVGANPTDFAEEQTLEKRTNYLLGADQNQWVSGVASHQKVSYSELYPGIQLAAYSHEGNFKYDFVVAAGANTRQIQLAYEGIEGLYLDKGDLVLPTNVGEIRELAPYAYQEIGGKEIEVPCVYELDDNVVKFAFPEGYNEAHPLVIDPTVVVATLAGSDVSRAFGHSATFDNGGNIYTAGISFGFGYPTTTGAFSEMYMGGLVDVVISKFNPDGSDLLYSTYIGGMDREYPYSTIVDDNGQLSFLGSSLSSDYPTTTNAYQRDYRGGTDIVVTKLSADGASLVGSTYLGGNRADGLNNSPFNAGGNDTYRGEIVLDGNGNIYIAANTQSTDFPVTPNAFQQSLGAPGDLGFPLDGIVS